jgi:hypothetical protein
LFPSLATAVQQHGKESYLDGQPTRRRPCRLQPWCRQCTAAGASTPSTLPRHPLPHQHTLFTQSNELQPSPHRLSGCCETHAPVKSTWVKDDSHRPVFLLMLLMWTGAPLNLQAPKPLLCITQTIAGAYNKAYYVKKEINPCSPLPLLLFPSCSRTSLVLLW